MFQAFKRGRCEDFKILREGEKDTRKIKEQEEVAVDKKLEKGETA